MREKETGVGHHLEWMLRTIRRKGLVRSEAVLEAMARVPRHLYAGSEDLRQAYGDHPLPIGEGQTISQPLMVALMSELLGDVREKSVLEVGTGSGYQAAVLAELGARVLTIERKQHLYRRAREVLESSYGEQVHCRLGDGSLGWPEAAPFDAIVVTAATDRTPPALEEQLAAGGRMVIPLGPSGIQYLTVIVKQSDGSLKRETGIGCRFVPLICS